MQDLHKIAASGKDFFLTQNSKDVKQGCIFFAIKNGYNFVDDAVKNGAKIVLSSIDVVIKNPAVKYIVIENLETVLPDILKIFYKQPKYICGVTGTNGKTSVCFLAAQLFSFDVFVKKAGYIGTLGGLLFCSGDSKKVADCSNLTTPDIVTLYRILDKLVLEGCDYVFLEASSIGLDQGRMNGLEIHVACFTNFSHDHLDYHKNMESYFACKTKLFFDFKPHFSILNSSLPNFLNGPKTFYSIDDVKIVKTESDFTDVVLLNGDRFCTKIYGKYQIENLLCVIKIAHAFGLNKDFVLHNIKKLLAPKGRLEEVTSSKIFIDYAHTPDALLNAILALKELGRIVVVFGCGGDRDKTKRHLMGKIASQNCDFAIITDDNPRSEDASFIRQDVILGFEKGFEFVEIANRRDAIQRACSLVLTKKFDCALIAGKGHEDYQIIKGEKFYFSDFEEVLKLL